MCPQKKTNFGLLNMTFDHFYEILSLQTKTWNPYDINIENLLIEIEWILQLILIPQIRIDQEK